MKVNTVNNVTIYTNNKDTDKLVNLHSLIRSFTVCSQESVTKCKDLYNVTFKFGQVIPASVCFANNKDTDQLVNPHSLIRVFAVRCQKLKCYYG